MAGECFSSLYVRERPEGNTDAWSCSVVADRSNGRSGMADGAVRLHNMVGSLLSSKRLYQNVEHMYLRRQARVKSVERLPRASTSSPSRSWVSPVGYPHFNFITFLQLTVQWSTITKTWDDRSWRRPGLGSSRRSRMRSMCVVQVMRCWASSQSCPKSRSIDGNLEEYDGVYLLKFLYPVSLCIVPVMLDLLFT
jgi:hypothetical protein